MSVQRGGQGPTQPPMVYGLVIKGIYQYIYHLVVLYCLVGDENMVLSQMVPSRSLVIAHLAIPTNPQHAGLSAFNGRARLHVCTEFMN